MNYFLDWSNKCIQQLTCLPPSRTYRRSLLPWQCAVCLIYACSTTQRGTRLTFVWAAADIIWLLQASPQTVQQFCTQHHPRKRASATTRPSKACCRTKGKLQSQCHLWCAVSLIRLFRVLCMRYLSLSYRVLFVLVAWF